jgi:hypothetical protein
VEGVGHSLAQRVSVSDQRDVDRGGNPRCLFELFHLRENAIVGHGIMEGTTRMSTQIGGRESNPLNDAAGKGAIRFGGYKRSPCVDQVAQFLGLARHKIILMNSILRNAARKASGLLLSN